MTKNLSMITHGVSEYKQREARMRQSADLDPTNQDKKLILDNFRKDGREALTKVLQDEDVQATTNEERSTRRDERQKTIKLIKQEARATTKIKEGVSFMDQYSRYPGNGYEKLSDAQKELVDQISVKNPNVIKEITDTAITVVTERGEFELPLQDTQIPSQYHHTNIPQPFLDKKKSLGLRDDCVYVTGSSLKEYYNDTKQDMLTKADVESIVALMPSGDEYRYQTRGSPMRQLMTLIGMTNQDLTSRAYSDGNADSDHLAEYGYVWLGAKAGDDDLLRSSFYSDEARLYWYYSNTAFRLRLFKKLSS